MVEDWEQGVRVPERCVVFEVFLRSKKKQLPDFLIGLPDVDR